MIKAKRMFVKGLIWQLSGVAFVYVLTGSIGVSIAYSFFRIGFYYVYHAMWKKIKWGKQ